MLSTLKDLIFPRSCQICQRRISQAQGWICHPCYQSLTLLTHHKRCHRCFFPQYIPKVTHCTHCVLTPDIPLRQIACFVNEIEPARWKRALHTAYRPELMRLTASLLLIQATKYLPQTPTQITYAPRKSPPALMQALSDHFSRLYGIPNIPPKKIASRPNERILILTDHIDRPDQHNMFINTHTPHPASEHYVLGFTIEE
ncbi:MAG: hypothetical protein S4CHLAM102_14750 [Chlamydiia bacterium]|nr:hypothetical protein [Chlamydiia bacterium]